MSNTPGMTEHIEAMRKYERETAAAKAWLWFAAAFFAFAFCGLAFVAGVLVLAAWLTSVTS